MLGTCVRPETRLSLGWYLGTILLSGQFLARVFLKVPFDPIFMLITGALVLVPIFGPAFYIALVRAIRSGEGSNVDAEGRANDDDGSPSASD